MPTQLKNKKDLALVCEVLAGHCDSLLAVGAAEFVPAYSVQQIERVVSMIDEVHASAVRANRQAEQRACAGAAGIDCLRGELLARRRRFDEVAIPGVHGEDVLVRRDRQAQGLIQASTRGDGRAPSSTGEAKYGIGNGGDAIAQCIGNVECPIACEPEACGTNDESCGIGALWKLPMSGKKPTARGFSGLSQDGPFIVIPAPTGPERAWLFGIVLSRRQRPPGNG
jgi:hypothetical protein